jgi:hypothetical protein
MTQKQTDGIKLIHTSSLAEAERLTKEGWEPIECSIDGQSVVGRLNMDHHGKLSHLEGVAVRAYRDHFGACGNGKVQGFVVTGDADADACFAIAALAGMLPHPSRAAEFAAMPWLPKTVVESLTADLGVLAELVNKIDVEPIKYVEELPMSRSGRLLLTWQAMKSGTSDRSAFHSGVDRWRHLTGTQAPEFMIAAAAAEEAGRIETVRHPTRISSMGKVALVECDRWGFDVWYNRHAPCVVWMKPNGEIDIGFPNKEVAEQLLGQGGLKTVLPELNKITGEGWGGREAICGGPRGQRRTWDEGVEISLMLADLIAERL